MKILFLMADPLTEDLPSLAALGEWQAVFRATAAQLAGTTLYQLTPPTWSKLRQTLNGRFGPFDIVHFISHGNVSGLALEDEYGAMDFVSADDLAIALTAKDVRLVVLNVCDAESPAAKIASAGIPSVIATSESITDNQATVLAQELYSGLAAGLCLEDALSQAKTSLIRTWGTKAAGIPVLIGDGSITFDIASQPAKLPLSAILGMPKHNLRQPSVYFGRRGDLHRGNLQLSSPDVRALHITGLGGIGKTLFALKLAHRCAWRFFGGAIWFRESDASLDSLQAFLLRGIRDVLNIPETGDIFSAERYLLDRIAERPLLLIFDDFDRLPESIQSKLLAFLERVPLGCGTKFILTTRIAVPEVDGLDGVSSIRLGGLEPMDARDLLRHHAALQGVSELADTSDDTLDELTRQLGYHPKMLELAVGLVRVIGLGKAIQSLHQLPAPYAEKVDAMLGEAVGHLAPNERETLRSCSTFSGPFKSEWLVGVHGSAALDGLPALIENNLLERNAELDDYELHPLVRDYILSKMPLGSLLFTDHARYLADHTSELSSQLSTDIGKVALHELSMIIDEVIVAVTRMASSEASHAQVLVRDLAAGVRDYLHFYRRDWPTIIYIENAAVEVCRAQKDRESLGEALTSLGSAMAASGDDDEGLELCSEGLDILSREGDAKASSVGWGAVGFIHRKREEISSAEGAYRQALKLAQEAGEPSLEIRHLSNLGTVRRMAKDWEGAESFYRHALERAQEIQDSLSEAILWDQLGLTARNRGELENSLQNHERAYDLKIAVWDRHGLRITRNNMASTLKMMGRPQEAVALLQENLSEFDDEDGVFEWWMVFLQLARSYRDMQAWKESKKHYETALEMAETAGYTRGVSMCERGIALCHVGEGNPELALGHIRRAVDLSTQTQDPYLSTLEEEMIRIEQVLG